MFVQLVVFIHELMKFVRRAKHQYFLCATLSHCQGQGCKILRLIHMSNFYNSIDFKKRKNKITAMTIWLKEI
jgi:hypothetical protein